MDDSEHKDLSKKVKIDESIPEKVFDQFRVGSLTNRTMQVFVRESSFQSLKHVLNRELHWAERLLWLIVTVFGVTLCSFGIVLNWKKMSNNLLQTVPNDDPSPIWSVPFPAVTICWQCPEQLISMKRFCEQACWGQQCTCCEALFTETKTEQGVCYTFNNVAAADLFNRVGISTELVLSNATQSIDNWSLQTGYAEFDAFIKYYPIRAMDLSLEYELKIKFRFAENDAMRSCGNLSTVSVELHNPTDFPYRADNAVLIESGQSVKIAILPKMTTGRRYLKFYCPDSTKCYFSDQRQLRFFRIYSQQNCELECRTNYLLDTRNCVLPYMPRPMGIQLCNDTSGSEDQLQKEILTRAISQGIPPSKYFVQSCRCFPACDDIRYKSVVSKNALNTSNFSEVVVRYEKDHFYGSKITIRYGIVDFLASCGGLLSLFLGISLITFVEMLYYCTLRPIFV